MSSSSDFFNGLITQIQKSININRDLNITEFAKEIIFNGEDKLFIPQKALLKAFYKEELNTTEKEVLEGWKQEERTTWVKDRDYMSLILEGGRRSSKCQSVDSTIITTIGEITVGELHSRLQKGERIGIITYDFSSDLSRQFTTYNIKTEVNAVEQTYSIQTERGIEEITNENHPFYTSFYNAHENTFPQWMTVKDIQEHLNKGKKVYVAHSNNISLFGKEELTAAEIKQIVKECNKEDKDIEPIEFKDKYNRLSKKSTLNLLTQVVNKLGAVKPIETHQQHFKPFNINYQHNFFLKVFNSKYRLYIYKQLLKFGIVSVVRSYEIAGRIRERYYHVPSLRISDLENLIALKDSIPIKPSLLRRMNEKIDLRSLKPRNKQIDKSKLFGWEQIINIVPKGVSTTIAIEVADTHVIGNYLISHNSTLASIICLKEFFDLICCENPQKKYNLLDSDPIDILVMAQSQAQVKETIFKKIKGYLENSDYFKGLIETGEIEVLTEEIRHYKKNVAIYAKHTNSKSLVGYTLKCMILDEVARFVSTGEENNNKAFEIWRNVACGGSAFGSDFKKIAISSAWKHNDPIEVLYNDCYKDPLSLGFQLTTFHLNTNIQKGITPVVVSDYTNDYDRARLEYEGIRYSKFDTFISREDLEKSCILTTIIDAAPSPINISSSAGERYYAGVELRRIEPPTNLSQLQFAHLDPALKKDSAALAIAHAEETEEGKIIIHIDSIIKWEPHIDKQGKRRNVSFLDIEEKLQVIHQVRPLYRVTMDQWNCLEENHEIFTKINNEWVTTPLTKVEEGDIVLSKEGKENKVVKRQRVCGVPSIKITTKSGYEIEGTLNHPILNAEGHFTELQHFNLNDKVKLNILNTEVNYSEDTIVSIEYTTSNIIHMEVSGDHTYCSQFINHNSESFIQKLHVLGIDSEVVSVSTAAQYSYYSLFKDLLSHDYIKICKDSLWSNNAVTELSEIVIKGDKISHPNAGKDLADAIVNVVYQVHQYLLKSGRSVRAGMNSTAVNSTSLSSLTQSSTNRKVIDIGSARSRLYSSRNFNRRI